MATRFEYECCICTDIDRDDREVVSIIVRAGDAIGHLLSSSIEVLPSSSKNDGAGPLNPAISCSLNRKSQVILSILLSGPIRQLSHADQVCQAI